MREKTTHVQLELNLHIIELRLKAQPSTPPEVKEQCVSVIQLGLEEIGWAVQECTGMLDQAFDILTSLQEDPNIQCLEIESRQLHEQYDSVRGTTQTFIFTRQLAKMQQERALKEQVDTTRQKEALLKARVQPWIDEAFTIMTKIEGNITQMQGLYVLRQIADPHKEASEEHVQQVQQIT